MIGVGEDAAEIIRPPQCVRGAADRVDLVAFCRLQRRVCDAGLVVRGIQHAERGLADRAGNLAAEDRIDDAARVHGRAHVAVAASAGDVEQAHALHEERPLL